MKRLSEKAPMCIRRAVFAVYVLIMLYLMLIHGRTPTITDYWAQFRENLNLIPFDSILFFIRRLFSHDMPNIIHAVKNLVGNVVMFFPLGFCLPWCFSNCGTLRKTLCVSAACITAVEIIQVTTLRGFCDIDDLMLNLIGVWVGYMIYKRIAKNDLEARK